MKIISCYVENFGKLHNYSINLSDGINVICQDNGWGKSTFAAFIRVMFYGFEGRGKDVEKNERMKYMPLQGGIFGGKLTFELNGEIFQVRRTFKSKPSEDKFELRNAKTNRIYNYDGKTPNSLGERIFKINRESFIRTVFIGQNDCATFITDSINAKLNNLVDNTDDINNFESAYDRLTKQINALNRNTNSSIPKRDREINKYKEIIEESNNISNDIEICQKELQDMKNQYIDLKTKLNRLDEPQTEITKSENQLSPFIKIGIVVIVLGIISVVLTSLKISMIIAELGLILIVVDLLVSNKTSNPKTKFEEFKNNVGNITEEIESVKSSIDNHKNKLNALYIKYDELEANKLKLINLKDKQDEEKQKYKNLLKAREKLKLAKEKMTAQYNNLILKTFKQYYQTITTENANNFYLDKDSNINLNKQNICLQSLGYKDLIWICLRLALVEAMYKEEIPVLIMDDPFTNLDDDKLKSGRKLLDQIAEKYQIIYFTCSHYRI